MSKQKIAILGSTGSIGSNTLAVIDAHTDCYQVILLSAYKNLNKLVTQCLKYKPRYAFIAHASSDIIRDITARFKDAKLMGNSISSQTQSSHPKQSHNLQLITHFNDLIDLITSDEVDVVMSALVGSSGLLPTYKAILAGKRVLLANKESLVIAGELMLKASHNNNANNCSSVGINNNKVRLIPVDSEHNAILQCLPNGYYEELRCAPYHEVNGYLNKTTSTLSDKYGITQIILTASGGPFNDLPESQIAIMTAQNALKHPNWQMGAKITIDSSTLMNKGLEYIEAYWLFGLPVDKINVIVHPQSIIHSMVRYNDGSVLAELGVPDMQTPIAYALSYPQRIPTKVKPLDLVSVGKLEFASVNETKFPCFALAKQAIALGGIMPLVLNAANEIAVDKFLINQISFYGISKLVASSMNYFVSKYNNLCLESIEHAMALDEEVRSYAALIH